MQPTTNLTPVVISVDTETGGNTAGSVIYQIAAVNHITGANFNVYIDRHNCLNQGLREDESTKIWWAEKPEGLRRRVMGGTTPLKDALESFAAWIHNQRQGAAPLEVYMKSPSFDSEKILKPACEIFGKSLPWTFREERDFRTIEAVAAAAGMRAYEPPKDAHDALVDAKAQATYVEMILGAVYEASMLAQEAAQESFQQKLYRTPQPLLAQPKEISMNPKDAIGSLKAPVHLWPFEATIYGSLALADGVGKYGRGNFLAGDGVQASIYFAALMRHMNLWFYGERTAADSHIHHLGHSLACLAILIQAEAQGKLIDDRAYVAHPTALAGIMEEAESIMKFLADKNKDRNPRNYDRRDL